MSYLNTYNSIAKLLNRPSNTSNKTKAMPVNFAREMAEMVVCKLPTERIIIFYDISFAEIHLAYIAACPYKQDTSSGYYTRNSTKVFVRRSHWSWRRWCRSDERTRRMLQDHKDLRRRISKSIPSNLAFSRDALVCQDKVRPSTNTPGLLLQQNDLRTVCAWLRTSFVERRGPKYTSSKHVPGYHDE